MNKALTNTKRNDLIKQIQLKNQGTAVLYKNRKKKVSQKEIPLNINDHHSKQMNTFMYNFIF